MARGTLHPKKANSAHRGATFAVTTLTDDGVVRGPELVEITGRKWDPDVLAWYDAWRRSPQAQIFASTDWQRLATLAVAMERYFAAPSAALLAEIRMNEERLGATVTDRLRARIEVTPAEDAAVLSMDRPGEESDEDILAGLQ